MKIKTGLFALALLLGAAGCGQTSFIEVTVQISNTGIDTSCLYSISSCQVTVTGAGGEAFTLRDQACHAPSNPTLGKFQYSTDQESGNVSFHVVIVAAVNGKSTAIGMGDASTTIKAGGRQAVTVPVMVTCPAVP